MGRGTLNCEWYMGRENTPLWTIHGEGDYRIRKNHVRAKKKPKPRKPTTLRTGRTSDATKGHSIRAREIFERTKFPNPAPSVRLEKRLGQKTLR